MTAPVPAARAWLAAVRTPAVAESLEQVYQHAAGAIAERGPACWASGRCCRFEGFGHRLYVTGLEAAYTVAHRESPVTLAQVDTALAEGGCPFQELNLCGAHEIKPLGCRVFFCDRTAQEWQNTLLETLHAEVKGIHTRFGVPYQYGEWRAMLGVLASP